jgi:hypothetical protein
MRSRVSIEGEIVAGRSMRHIMQTPCDSERPTADEVQTRVCRTYGMRSRVLASSATVDTH